METKINTSRNVKKVLLSFEEVARLKAALPLKAFSAIAFKLGHSRQTLYSKFTQVSVRELNAKQRAIDEDLILACIEKIQSTGNTSFDYIKKRIEDENA